MPFHYVEPEVAGELGPNSIVDASVHPPLVSHLEYRFTDWLGDDIVETFPCFIVTEKLATHLAGTDLTGITLADVEVTLSPEAHELLTEELPAWKWLQITGIAFLNDFGVSDDQRLVVSDNALAALRNGSLDNVDLETAE